ncbi:MAG: hypothetical protein GY799_03150 [Desulfobulbaceae bacterium]|nr:hypothetical protein [Desulfobulbaceae bacterium]
MIKKCQLLSFKKMWTWLSGYPAHDRKYYMKHVARTGKKWMNNCPLSNSELVSNCDGCKLLWPSGRGTLCTDPNAPLFKWRATDVMQPDYRSFYASQVAVLALKAMRNPANKMANCHVGTSQTGTSQTV